jgi:hypothetical protein
MFYEDKINKAVELTVSQLQDGWTEHACFDNWQRLGYEYFWTKMVLKKALTIYPVPVLAESPKRLRGF